MVLLSILAFSLSAHMIAWRECWLSHTCIMWSHEQKWDRTPWLFIVLKIFSLLGVLSTLIFILCCFCPMLLLSIFSFLCPPTWSNDKNVYCPHLYHVIIWNRKWDRTSWLFGVLKNFLFWGFCPLWFLSFGAFCPMFAFWLFLAFSLSAHVTAWQECWLSTPVSCDHMNRNGIIHLDCWSIKIFSLWGFCMLWFLSFGSFVLWCFCPF